MKIIPGESQRCDECSELSNAVVEIGAEPDWESATAYVCAKCIEKAFRAFDAEAAETAPNRE